MHTAVSLHKRIIALVLVIIVATGLVSCGKTGTKDRSSLETVIFTDDSGREVEVLKDITRIIPSGSLAQLILFAIAPEKFVGLAAEWDSSAKGIIADEYLNLPYYGQFYGSADVNIEELAKADPDIVIDIGEVKENNVEDLDNFTMQTGVPVVFIQADLEHMDETFIKLGKLLGKEEKAAELAAFCRETYDRAQSIMDKVGEDKVTALYLQGDVGLNAVARDSYHSEVLDLVTENAAVIENPTGKGLGNEVSMEQIALWNPEFIVFGTQSIYDMVSEMSVWSEIKAIKGGYYVETPDVPYCWMGTPVSVQRYLSLLWLPYILYPEYCDYDLKEEVFEYYRMFYGCDLTDEQYEAITKNAFFK